MTRLPLPVSVAVGAFVLTGLTQASLQLVRAHDVISKATADDRFTIAKTLAPKRGALLTADGKPIAQDIAAWQLSIKFPKVPKSRGFFVDLAAASGIPEADLERLSDTTEEQSWPNSLNRAQADAVDAVKTRWKADGVSVASAPDRSYPFGMDGAAISGTLDAGIKARGLEGKYDAELKGIPGKQIGLVDRTGTFEPARLDSSSTPKVNGADVVTTIDSTLQRSVSEAVRGCVATNDAVSGTVIVMRPDTGEILAMAGAPAFNPSAPTSKIEGERISGIASPYMSRIEPGSMLKILTLSKAFDAKVVKATDTYNCQGELAINNVSRVRCAMEHGHRNHGVVTPAKAIAMSCNVSAARWAMMIGKKPFFDFLDSLGLFETTDLGLPGEIKGSINRKDWAWKLQLANLGFGQSLTCTPVELAGAFTAIGNGGVRMQPRLVSQIGGKTVPMVPGKRVISEESANTVLGYMKGVIDESYGTGYALRLPGYEIAGKTGTAQKKNGSGGYVSNFVGFIPAEHPQAMVLVMIDHPRKGAYYGAAVAGPVFKQVAEAVIRRYRIPPTNSIQAEPKAKP